MISMIKGIKLISMILSRYIVEKTWLLMPSNIARIGRAIFTYVKESTFKHRSASCSGIVNHCFSHLSKVTHDSLVFVTISKPSICFQKHL